MNPLLPLVVVALGLAFALLRLEQHRLDAAAWKLRNVTPIDADTGLLSRSTFEQRVQAETRRIDRFGGRLHIWVAGIDGGTATTVAAGSALHEALSFPRLGFRLGDDLLCAVVPEAADAPIDPATLSTQLAALVPAAIRSSGMGSYEARDRELRDVLADALLPVVAHDREAAA